MKKICELIGYAGQFVMWHFPISILALSALYFSYNLWTQPPSASTTAITNYSFAIVATLAALSFTYEKALTDQEEKDRMLFCGERFLHSAILFLTASVINYFLRQPDIQQLVTKGSSSVKLLFLVVFFCPGFLFIASVASSIAALRELNALLYRKKKPGDTLKRLF